MKISILGCGWLGLPLAEHLIKQKHIIKGSTTSPDKIERLRQKGIAPFLIKFSPQPEFIERERSFFKADVLVLNIPPGRGHDNVIDYHTRQIKAIIEMVKDSTINFVIFISSTSVYPSYPGTVTEKDAVPGSAGRDSGNALLKAEQMLIDATSFETTVLRFGGLYGSDRHPAKYMAGKQNLPKANAPVNLIHRDDCIAIITQIIEEHITGEVFNAVSDGHPTRQDYYTKAAKTLGLEPPIFDQDQTDKNYKIVDSTKLKKRLPYTFMYPDPLLPLA